MKKILIIFLIIFICPDSSLATVSLPWSTTYDCADWTQTDGAPVGCDDLVPSGAWTASPGDEEEQIMVEANFSGGDGGKGQRHKVGDGVNNNSGGTKIQFTSSQPELWIRYYIRYELGFQWTTVHYDKHLYVDAGDSDWVIPGFIDDKFTIGTNASGGYSTSSGKWNALMGGSTSDGQFHAFELHIKMDTDGTDGELDLWVDGVLQVTSTSVDFGTTSGWEDIIIGSNQDDPNNGGVEGVDYDDISINNTGYIGLIGTGNTSTFSSFTGDYN